VPNFVEMVGGPDETRNTGQVISDAADALAAKAKDLHQTITGIDTEAPWGTDQYGVAFLNSYHNIDDQGRQGDRIDLYLQQSLVDSGSDLSKLGNGVLWAMNDYQSAETENVTTISSVTKH
jgi:hypothetical protein